MTTVSGFRYGSVALSDSMSSFPSLTRQATSSDASAAFGYLSGQGIEAVGAALINVFIRLVIQGRLSAARSLIVYRRPMSDRTIERVYDDLLELARPGVNYSPSIRKQAMELLMKQIKQQSTEHLIKSLVKWPADEIRFFLKGVMNHIVDDSSETYRNNDLGLPVEGVYQRLVLFTLDRTSANADPNLALSFVHLIVSLLKASHSCCEAVLDSDVLTVFLLWYLMDFRYRYPHPLSDHLRLACQSALEAVTRPHTLPIFSQHPLVRLMPHGDLDLPHDYFLERREIWNSMRKEDPLFRWRLGGISCCVRASCFQLSSNPMNGARRLDALVALVDLLEFATSASIKSSLSKKALRLFLEWIKLETDVSLMAEYLERRYAGTVDVLVLLFDRVRNWTGHSGGDDKHPYINEFTLFLCRVAKSSPACRETLAMAGIGPVLRDLFTRTLGENHPALVRSSLFRPDFRAEFAFSGSCSSTASGASSTMGGFSPKEREQLHTLLELTLTLISPQTQSDIRDSEHLHHIFKELTRRDIQYPWLGDNRLWRYL